MNNLFLFFTVVVGVLPLSARIVFLLTKNATLSFAWGFFLLFGILFMFILPMMENPVYSKITVYTATVLVVIGIMSILVIIFFVANEVLSMAPFLFGEKVNTPQKPPVSFNCEGVPECLRGQVNAARKLSV